MNKNEENKIKAAAVMSFINTMIGAFEAGFVDKNNLTLAELFRVAQNHLSDNYGIETPDLKDQWGAPFALTCAAKLDSVNHEGLNQLFADALIEAEKAMVKHPQPNYVLLKFAEESGEVIKDGVHCAEGRQTLEKLRGEMKQTIAMIIRLCIEGDETIGLAPVLGIKS